MNTDAVFYIRIAQYYASGQTELMISCYWGPLLGWIIVPIIPFVDEPLFFRVYGEGGPSLVFLLGGWAVFRSMKLGFLRWLWLSGL